MAIALFPLQRRCSCTKQRNSNTMVRMLNVSKCARINRLLWYACWNQPKVSINHIVYIVRINHFYIWSCSLFVFVVVWQHCTGTHTNELIYTVDMKLSARPSHTWQQGAPQRGQFLFLFAWNLSLHTYSDTLVRPLLSSIRSAVVVVEHTLAQMEMEKTTVSCVPINFIKSMEKSIINGWDMSWNQICMPFVTHWMEQCSKKTVLVSFFQLKVANLIDEQRIEIMYSFRASVWHTNCIHLCRAARHGSL